MPIEPTWATRELPVLAATLEYLETHRGVIPESSDLAVATGMDVERVELAITALCPTYLTEYGSTFGVGHRTVSAITDEGRRAVGQWPSPEAWADQIVEGLTLAAESEPDEDRRSRLRAAAETLGGIARDVTVSVLTGAITKSTGMG